MSQQNILKELNVHLQIVRVNKNLFTGSFKLRRKANRKISELMDRLK